MSWAVAASCAAGGLDALRVQSRDDVRALRGVGDRVAQLIDDA